MSPLNLSDESRYIVAMFIRKVTRKYKDRVYTNYLLVQSVHTPKGPRQKVICSLGDLSPRPAEEWLRLAHKVEDALLGQSDLFARPMDAEVEQIVRQVRHRAGQSSHVARGKAAEEELIAVHTDRVRVEHPREAGPVHVGYQFWKRLGLDEILRSLGFSARVIQLSCAMTLNRLVYPASEHAMPRWIRSTALHDILGIDFVTPCDDSLYRNLDRLYPNRAESAFRSMKTPLAERPIFHHLERRVETHIFLCVLAYHLLVAIETTLLGHGLHTSWATVRETLATHQVVTIVLPTDRGRILNIRKGTTPEPEHQELYRLLNVPEEIIRPRRTWITPPMATCSD